MHIQDIREVYSPLSSEMLQPLPPETLRLQVRGPLSDDGYAQVARLLEGRPDVAFRRYGHDEVSDLGFLKHFAQTQRVHIDLFHLQSMDGIENLTPNLRSLWLRENKRRLKMEALGRFQHLHSAGIHGQVSAVEVLAKCHSLRHLSLGSVKLPDLSAITSLTNLESLSLSLGGTSNLAGIELLQSLKYLDLVMVRGLADISLVSRLHNLEMLELNTLKNIDALPDLSQTKLNRIELQTMRGIHDLSPLLDCPNLETCDLIEMQHLSVEEVTVLSSHPKLHAGIAHIGLIGKCNKALSALGWTRPTEFFGEERRRKIIAS